MGCSSCSNKKNGLPSGCGNNGHCASGACNKMSTFDWFSDVVLPEDQRCDLVEITFNNGPRKGFYRKRPGAIFETGDYVAVDASYGFDIGQITLSGELVRLQLKKYRTKEDAELPFVQRVAQEKELEAYYALKEKEKAIMVEARAIARTENLEMKISIVELQADGRKATFYYISDHRVDFRNLIKLYAKAFKVKIEMRQIGARQESGIIGGIGSCGRELCCSTWLTDFKSVSTQAARYQQLSINQAKLSGQCGRLKCCLNFELDSYMEAFNQFPKKADKLSTKEGEARLLKIDIFKQVMFYTYPHKAKYYQVPIKRVNEILALNKDGKKPDVLLTEAEQIQAHKPKDEYEDVVGQISLASLEKTAKKRKNRNRKTQQNRSKTNDQQEGNKTDKSAENQKRDRSSGPRRKKPRPSKKPTPTGNNSNTPGSQPDESSNQRPARKRRPKPQAKNTKSTENKQTDNPTQKTSDSNVRKSPNRAKRVNKKPNNNSGQNGETKKD